MEIKISELPADPTPSLNDLIMTVKNMEGGLLANRKVTIANLFAAIEEWWWMKNINIALTVPITIPTIAMSTSKIEATPVSGNVTLTVPTIPTIAVSTQVT